MKDVTDRLLAEGVQLFADAFAKLLKAVEKQSKEAGAGKINRLTYTLPEPLAAAVNDSLAEWRAQGKVRRLWGRDASLWTGKDEAHWLGWLGVTNDQLAHIERLDPPRRSGQGRRLLPRPPAGHGGIEPRPRSDEDDLREDHGLPGAPRARFDRPGPGEGVREQGRSEEHALHRLEQIGLHARAQHLQAVLLRPRRRSSSARRKPAGASSPSPIPARSCSRSPRATAFDTSSSAGRISVGATRRSPISAWSRRPSWAWMWRSSWIGPRRWSLRACRRFRSKRTPASCSAPSSASPRRNFGRDKVTIIASPGISRSRRLAGAAAGGVDGQGRQGPDPDRSRSRSARPMSMATTVSSSISDCGRRPMRHRTRPSPSWNEPVIRSCASRSTIRTTWARSSSAGRSRPPWPVPSSASTRSISRTWKPARS